MTTKESNYTMDYIVLVLAIIGPIAIGFIFDDWIRIIQMSILYLSVWVTIVLFMEKTLKVSYVLLFAAVNAGLWFVGMRDYATALVVWGGCFALLTIGLLLYYCFMWGVIFVLIPINLFKWALKHWIISIVIILFIIIFCL